MHSLMSSPNIEDIKKGNSPKALEPVILMVGWKILIMQK